MTGASPVSFLFSKRTDSSLQSSAAAQLLGSPPAEATACTSLAHRLVLLPSPRLQYQVLSVRVKGCRSTASLLQSSSLSTVSDSPEQIASRDAAFANVRRRSACENESNRTPCSSRVARAQRAPPESSQPHRSLVDYAFGRFAPCLMRPRIPEAPPSHFLSSRARWLRFAICCEPAAWL